MSLQSEQFDPLISQFDPLASNQDYSKGLQKSILPAKVKNEIRKMNIYDDPLVLLMDEKIYLALVFFCMLISNNVIVFFRHRIGRRIMRGWLFQVLFFFLIAMGGLANFAIIHEVNWLIIIYAIAMAVLAFYHHVVAKELTHADNPQDMLHTMARGDSHLLSVMANMPVVKIPMWNFYYRRRYEKQIFPLQEREVQQILEPAICLLLALILIAIGQDALGGWLATSGLFLFVVESDRHTVALNNSLDTFDSKIEARVMRAIDEHYDNQGRIQPKINGIATTSGIMLQLIKEKRKTDKLSNGEAEQADDIA